MIPRQRKTAALQLRWERCTAVSVLCTGDPTGVPIISDGLSKVTGDVVTAFDGLPISPRQDLAVRGVYIHQYALL